MRCLPRAAATRSPRTARLARARAAADAADAADAPAPPVLLLQQDSSFAVVLKQAGVEISRGAGGRHERRTVEGWVASHPWAGAPLPRPASTLERPFGGLVLLSKTPEAAAAAAAPGALGASFAAVVVGVVDEVRLLQALRPAGVASLHVTAAGSSASFAALTLLELHTRPAASGLRLCAELARCGHPVVGGSAAAPSAASGGAFLARTALEWPGADGRRARCEVPPPRKMGKLLRREALAAQRAAAAAAAPDAGDFDVHFAGIVLLASASVLAPRPSTAAMVDACVAAAAGYAAPRLLDLGTGTGCILLAALKRLGGAASGSGLDLDGGALSLAALNASRVVPARHVSFVRGDFGALHTPELRQALHAEGYHVIVCNPPYLARTAATGRHTAEPDGALVAGESGLEAYTAVCSSLGRCVPPLLAAGGRLLLQLPGGAGGADRVRAAVAAVGGFHEVGITADYRGVARCLELTVAPQ